MDTVQLNWIPVITCDRTAFLYVELLIKKMTEH